MSDRNDFVEIEAQALYALFREAANRLNTTPENAMAILRASAQCVASVLYTGDEASRFVGLRLFLEELSRAFEGHDEEME